MLPNLTGMYIYKIRTRISILRIPDAPPLPVSASERTDFYGGPNSVCTDWEHHDS